MSIKKNKYVKKGGKPPNRQPNANVCVMEHGNSKAVKGVCVIEMKI